MCSVNSAMLERLISITLIILLSCRSASVLELKWSIFLSFSTKHSRRMSDLAFEGTDTVLIFCFFYKIKDFCDFLLVSLDNIALSD